MAVAAYDPGLALAEFRRARVRKRLADVHWIDLLYQAYLTAILGGMVVLFASSFVGDADLDTSGIAHLRSEGPAFLGVVAALAAAVGLRSGARGGPLALEAPEVRHVLLAPVDRRTALRGPAWRQVRFTVFCGSVVGAVAGQLAVRRLPGAPLAWVASGAAFGAAAMTAALGLALVVSGRHLPRVVTTPVAGLSLAWAVAEAAGDHGRAGPLPPSPFSLLARLALWPLHVDAWSLLPAAGAAVALVAGMAALGGQSVESAERRSSLVGQLRFAATLQDIRTVIVLRRQLAMELPRLQPYARRGIPGMRRLPVWGRGWRGVLRWPAARVGRVVLLGAIAGLCLRGVWSGTTPLVLVAGLAMFVAGLDAVEPLAQEIDHPERRDSFPLTAGELGVRHLGVPFAVMVLVALPAFAAGVLAAPAARAVQVAAVAVVPAALGAVAGATVSVVMGAPAQSDAWQLLPPEVAGMRLAVRTAWPPLLAVAGVVPVLVARDVAERGYAPVPAETAAAVVVAVLAAFVVAWVRFRDAAKAWWAEKLEAAGMGAAPVDVAADNGAGDMPSSTSGPHRR